MVKLPDLTVSSMVNQADKTNKNLLVATAAFMNFAVVLWLAIYWLMGLNFSTNVPLAYQFVSIVSLAYYFKTKQFEIFRFVQLSLFLFAPFIMQWSLGSSVTSSGVTLWALLAPIAALMVSSWREAIPWFFAYIVLTILSGVFDYFLGVGNNSGVPLKTIGVFFAMNFVVMSSILFLLVRHFVIEMDKLRNQLVERQQLLTAEQSKSQQLLLNILPGEIADRMQSISDPIADKHKDATVMFADLVNFTQLTEALAPPQLLALLNTIFSGFDELAAKYGLEKIRTVGDVYVVAGGLGGNKVDYTSDIANLAYDMREFVATHPDVAKFKLALHVGIASGPVIAGVVGKERFNYDMWGTTVNLAYQLTGYDTKESYIRIDQTTHNRVRLFYTFGAPQMQVFRGQKEETSVYELTGKVG